MGTAGVDQPATDMVVRLGPGQRLSHSLPLIRETFYTITLQVIIPLGVAGLGMVWAGIYLERVSKWAVFKEVTGIIVLVPALLGLKGNLEMTLASRLSTEANLGNMDDAAEQKSMILANLVLVQCQGTVVGMLSALLTVCMVLVTENKFNLNDTLMLCACSTLTASIASFILGFITCAVIVLCKRFHWNPDNIATPIAGALGDFVSLFIFANIAQFFYKFEGKIYLSTFVIAFYIFLTPFWVLISKKNKYTKAVLYNGWSPVVIAMMISTFAGKVLDSVMTVHSDVPVFQPVINGLGGNLVSIQASRLSTALHQQSEIGTLPEDVKLYITPIQAFFSDTQHALTSRVLMVLMFFYHVIFVYTISYLHFHTAITLPFLVAYLLTAAIQVATLLYIAYILTHCFWTKKINPDNSTIPYLTAVGDLLGISLLGLMFWILRYIGQPTTY